MSAAAELGFAGWLGAAPGSEPDWLRDRRARARARVAALGIPTTKAEDWRYTSLTRLLELGLGPLAAGPAETPGLALAPLLIPGLETHRVVLVNGRFAPALSDLRGLAAGVRISGLRQAIDTDPDALSGHLEAGLGEEPPLFAALNTAGLDDGMVVLVERGARPARPIELIHVAGGLDSPRVVQPRLVVSLGDGAEATLIERYLGRGEVPSCTNAVVEVRLGRDAALRHQRIQAEGPAAFHLSGIFLAQGTGSRYEGINISLGAAWARTEFRAGFEGEHARCDVSGLYLAGDRQLSDFHLDLDHRLAHCTSREHFKGILYGKGRAVFDGRVVVARDAQQTDAAMNNRNLLLSEGAEVDTKPQLEINADDVKCSHGTTVGQIDPEQLFYLRSRGLGAPLARRLLCLGFAGEVLDALTPLPLRDQVAEAVGERLEQAPFD